MLWNIDGCKFDQPRKQSENRNDSFAHTDFLLGFLPLLEATRSCLICLDLENMIMHKLSVLTIVHRCSCLPGFEAFIPLPRDSAVQSRF